VLTIEYTIRPHLVPVSAGRRAKGASRRLTVLERELAAGATLARDAEPASRRLWVVAPRPRDIGS
jgi:hypothetical protein